MAAKGKTDSEIRARKGKGTTTESSADEAGSEQQMTLDEKIAAIDREIQTIHHFFVAKGYTPLEIEHGARPLLDKLKRASRRRLALTAIKVAVILLIAYGFIHYDPAYKVALKFSRIALVKYVLPYWDWQSLYDKTCVVDNPYFEGERIYQEDCEICEGLKEIPREANITPERLTDKYMNRDLPVIISDATDDWPARKLFNTTFLTDLFLKTPKIKDYSGCYFASNVRGINSNNKLFLKKASSGLTDYYAHWENCMSPVAKRLREYYDRPYFLPASSDMQKYNWIFISKDYSGKKFKPIPLEAPFIWYAQIKGDSMVKALPKHPCNETCEGAVDILQEGELLFMTDRIWFLDYLPNGGGENIAIASGGHFD